MGDKRNLREEVGSSADDSHCVVPSKYFPLEEHSENARTKLLSSKPVHDVPSLIEYPPFLQSQLPFMTHARNMQKRGVPLSVNNAFLNNGPGDYQNFGLKSHFPQEPESASSKFIPLKPGEAKAWINENPSFPRSQFPLNGFETRIVPNFQTAMNAHIVSDTNNLLQFRSPEDSFVDFSSFGRNTNRHFRNEYSSSNQNEYMLKRMEHLSSGQSENLQKGGRFLSNGGEKCIENAISSSGNGKDEYISNSNLFDIAYKLLAISDINNSQVRNLDFKGQKDDTISSNEREDESDESFISASDNGKDQCISNTTILNVASKILAISVGNDTQARNPEFTDHLSLINNSYCQLYSQTLPENYDFAMNIMAYIEILNDCTWRETFTYFDENVKILIKYIWNGSKNIVDNNVLLQQNRCDFLQLMECFSENTLGQKYNLGDFLQYCVIMCQLGVLARKRNFTKAPLYVIDFLRKGINGIENSLSITFEVYIKKHAQGLVKFSKV